MVDNSKDWIAETKPLIYMLVWYCLLNIFRQNQYVDQVYVRETAAL